MTAAELEAVVRRYFEGCNQADVALMTGCMTDDCVHYFPPGMYGGPWRGARTIADNWVAAVGRVGSCWTIERMIVDAGSLQAVAEWTHWKTSAGAFLRGDEWYRFEAGPDGPLISEIRAYYAAPQDSERTVTELEGFDYAANGYALEPPLDAYPRPR